MATPKNAAYKKAQREARRIRIYRKKPGSSPAKYIPIGYLSRPALNYGGGSGMESMVSMPTSSDKSTRPAAKASRVRKNRARNKIARRSRRVNR